MLLNYVPLLLEFVLQASSNLCIPRSLGLSSFPWLGTAGRSWTAFQRHLLFFRCHLSLSYLPFASPIFFFHYNIYCCHFHLSQFHSLSAYWPIKTYCNFFSFIDFPLGEGRKFVSSFLLPFHIAFSPLLLCICELQPPVWFSGGLRHIAVVLHSFCAGVPISLLSKFFE